MQSQVMTHVARPSRLHPPITRAWPVAPPDPEAWPNLWARCWAKIQTWQVPPRWTLADWRDESRAQGALAACEALRDFRVNRAVPRAAFLYQRVVAAAWTRYRQEWSFGRRAHDISPVHEREAPGSTHPDPETIEHLALALEALPEADRRLIVQLFWDGRAEDELAASLGMTRQGINKRKHMLLNKLRFLLDFEP